MNHNFLSRLRSHPAAMRQDALLGLMERDLLSSSGAASTQPAGEAMERWVQEQPFAGVAYLRSAPRGGADDVAGPVSAWSGTPFHAQVEIVGEKVALMRVHGPIGKHLEPWEMYYYGACDLAVIDQQLENIARDRNIETLVVDFRTPGGCTIGLEETAGRLVELEAQGVHTVAYADSDMCSAGYHMAAACTEIHASSGAVVGSISTYMSAIDSSGLFAMNGLQLILVRSGKWKALGVAGREWTEQDVEHMAALLQTFDGPFKAFVSARRGLTAEDMQGQWWQAKDAPSGVVDSAGEVRSLREMLGLVI